MLGYTIKSHLIHCIYVWAHCLLLHTVDRALHTRSVHKSSWTIKIMGCTEKTESTKIIIVILNKKEAGLPLWLLEVLYGWMLSQNIRISYFFIFFCPPFPSIGLTSFQYLSDSKVKWSLPRYTSSLHNKVSKHTCHTKSLINSLSYLVWWP